jgi:2',3'-cyclic-nucleotide 2'-phosphodiesterase (5'-nucleotidase family)
VGYTLTDLPDLIFPGNLDPYVVIDPTTTVNSYVDFIKSKGNYVSAIVAIGHIGATGGNPPYSADETSDLVTFADSLNNVDVVFGGHTHTHYLLNRPNGRMVVQNPHAGLRFLRVRVTVDTNTKQVIYKTADFHKPWNIGVTPDPEIQAYIDELNAELAPFMSTVLGEATKYVPRADQCARIDGRLCESLIGNLSTDSMRTAHGVDFAITNSGGLRADLTCPTVDLTNDFCPPYVAPPYPITRGSVLGVLPFGNVVVTADVSGAEVKAFLENGVSLMPAANGRFPQVSGLCFTYDIEAPAGSRVVSAVREVDGSCTADPVDLTDASSYTLATNDFVSLGGDGYPNIYYKATTWDLMDETLADYITATTPVNPFVNAFPDGRINCFDPNPGSGNNCPALVPSPPVP